MSVITERNAALPPSAPTAAPASAFPAAPDTDELAATISDLLSRGPTDAFAFEHALAGLVRAAREDRSTLRDVLRPVIDKGLAPQLGRGQGRDLPLATPLRQLLALAVNAVWLPISAHRYGHVGYSSYAGHTNYLGHPGYARDFELVRLVRRLSLSLDRPPGMDPYALRTPADILTLRLAELADRIADPAPVKLVSTPTDPYGWIDADVLIARVAEAESAGWQPWPLDFDQALLRLPEKPGPAAVRATHQLVSPAGRRLAGWLRGGRPSLPSGADLVTDPDAIPGKPVRSPRVRPLITLPDPPLTGPISGHTPSTLIHLLRRGWYPPCPLADGSCWTVCWPALLPGHPDLIAISAAWHPRHPDAHGAPCPAPLLPELAQVAQAQARGSDTFPAIARALTSRSPAKRAEAADTFATLAASRGFDADRFAAALAAFATRTDRQVLRSAVPALQHVLTRHMSTRAPASVSGRMTTDRAIASALGMAILGWLPAILPPAVDQPLPYTSHLLNLAADALTSANAARTPTQPTPAPTQPTAAPTPPPAPAPPPAANAANATVSAAIDALTRLANRPSRSPVSDAAGSLLAALTQA